MGDHFIDMIDFIDSVYSDKLCHYRSSKPCIFKVPPILRRHNPKSFTPNSFSFGPLHHAQEHLKETEEIKKYYLAKLLARKPTPRTYQEEFKRSILEVEERARKCYAFPTDHLDKDKFVEMLILDGCFIIELFRNNEIDKKRNYSSSNNTLDEDDPVFSVSWVLQDLYHDSILLENQIPWFVLECLFEMTSEKIPDMKSLTVLALDFFGTIFSGKALPSIPDDVKINHILDLIRNSLTYSSERRRRLSQRSDGLQQIPTATSLKESGIKFKNCESSNLLGIRFSLRNGVLEIPSLLIQEITCDAFRNFISYELCNTNCGAEITSYVVLLNNLIHTTKDINVLREADIITNWLNSNEMLELFKTIHTDTYLKEFCYGKICEEVDEYTKRFWPKIRESIMHNIFVNPLVIMSEIGAVIVLILTFLQTLFSVLQYFKKDSSPSPLS